MELKAQPANSPLPFDTIKKLVDEQQWVKIYNKKTRILLGLGERNTEINAKTQQYLQEEVMPDVYKTIDEFLVKNSLSLIGYWDFCKYGATVVDKEQYLAFSANDRREAPKPNWEKFDELDAELKKLGNVQIVGSKNPQTGDPTWTIKSEVSKELIAERAELLEIVEKVKAKFNEFDRNQAQLEQAKKVDDGEEIEEKLEPTPEPQPESENLTPDEPKTEDEEKTPEPQEEAPVEPEIEEKQPEKTQDVVEPEWKPEPEEAPGKETKTEETK